MAADIGILVQQDKRDLFPVQYDSDFARVGDKRTRRNQFSRHAKICTVVWHFPHTAEYCRTEIFCRIQDIRQ